MATPNRYRVPHLGLKLIRERSVTVPHVTVTSPLQAAAVAHASIGARPVEHLIAILLDGRSTVTGIVTLAQGGMSSAAVGVRDVLRPILVGHAAAFILAHNHPSGDPKASPEDIAMTAHVRAAAEIVGLPMLDHVIVTRDATKWSVVE